MLSSTSEISLELARLSLCFSLHPAPNHEFLRMGSPKQWAEKRQKRQIKTVFMPGLMRIFYNTYKANFLDGIFFY
jgi:hypothetical protein